MITLAVLVQGYTKVVVAVVVDGRCLCERYLNSLDVKTYERMMARMALMANQGHIGNETIFRLLRDGIYEFKAKYARILCFFHDNYVVCTHGTNKKSTKQMKVEILKAKRIRDNYFIDRR